MLRSADVNLGFKGLQDLCAGGLASLTANYFLEKLLVGWRPWHAPWNKIMHCYVDVTAAGSFANSAHQALLGAAQNRPYCRCGTDGGLSCDLLAGISLVAQPLLPFGSRFKFTRVVHYTVSGSGSSSVHSRHFVKAHAAKYLCTDWSIPSLLLMHILQTLCAVVQHHLQLIKQLQQQMWDTLGSPGQASAASVLLGLQHRYTRTAEAMLTIAAPTRVVGMASV